MSVDRRIKCAVVGGSGYVGGELVRLLLNHPHVDLVAVTAREAAGRELSSIHPNLTGSGLVFAELTEVGGADTLFLALPNGETMGVLSSLPDRDLVDTSADFRLRSSETFETYYKKPHTCPERVSEFTYGLPELYRQRLRDARHIAAPGCFATATTLALFPLVNEDLCDSIVVTAVTGSSGSGIKPKDRAHHPFRTDSYFAYETFTHRHQPEIQQALSDVTGRLVDFVFQPHSGPFARGIFVTAIIRLSREIFEAGLKSVYATYYGPEWYVRMVDGSPNVKWVRGTNFCDISVRSDGKTAVVMAAIDNLLKGAASQAIQAFNIKQGLPERAGLPGFGANA